MQRSLLFAVGLAVASSACAPTAPPRWQEGGAPLLIAPAVWERPNDDPIEIKENGQVLEDGDLLFVVDRAGRIVDEDYEPVALLLPDGVVAGTDNYMLGRVGVSNAAPPNGAAAWLAIMPNGQVIFFDTDGERQDAGVWRGCNGHQRRTCTLVSHALRLRYYSRRRRGGFSVGVGVLL